MNFGRRRSFSSIEEDRTSSSPGARAPLHQYYERSAGGRSPARFSLSSVPGVDVPMMSGGCSPCKPWVHSPLHRLDGEVHALAVARGFLFTASDDSGRVRAWAAPECCDRGHLSVGRGRVQALAACGDTLVTSHGRDHRVRVWTVGAAAVGDHVRARKAATLPADGSLPILCFGRKRPHHHRDAISCLVLHAAAGLLYTASHDRTVKAWKLPDSTCVDFFVAHDGPINAMAVNEADDGCIFTGSSDGTVKMWRRVPGCGAAHALVVVLRSGPEAPSCPRCFLYAGSSDGDVNVWEKKATVGRPAHVGCLKGHRLAVYCLASGCSGRVVVSGSEDATMRVWRREGKGGGGGAAHTCLAVIDGHRGPVRCLAVGDGQGSEVEGRSMVVYSAGLDKSVKIK
ncbi:protein JINGUBANG-like [Panicum virgatum]|uniref:protein JINGUBANG-like n=1 Tax=Panicum virgatum TaxID=38727 RepID=UPI0019D674EC|nr:protein JINGUBANG-like [Panicum virgatum]